MSEKGLREINAADTKISDIDGEAGRLWYVGYEIGDLAAHASFEETIYLLHKLDLPNRQQLQQLKTFLVRRTGAPPLPREADADAGAERLADVDAAHRALGLERLRPRRLGRFPRGRVPQGAPPDRRDPDPDRDLRPTPDGPRGDPAEPRAQPRRQPPVDAPRRGAGPRRRQGARHDVRALRGPHDERLDVHRPRDRLDAVRHVLGDHRRDRRAEGTAARRGERGVTEDGRGGRQARERRGLRPRAAREPREDHGVRPRRVPHDGPAGPDLEGALPAARRAP